MKIREIQAIFPKYKHIGPSWRTHFWQIVVRIETDTGVTGYGYGGGGVAGVEIVNRHFKELLLGRNINSIEDIQAIWDFLYDASLPYGRRGLAVMALSGVDLALYDLLGKVQGEPVYKLLGSLRRERTRAYATGPDAEVYRDLGYTAHKFTHLWNGCDSEYDAVVTTASRARELFGPDALLMIDSYMSWDEAVTRKMIYRLKEFNMYWFEDVLKPDDVLGQAALKPDVRPSMIAGGEHEFTQHGFAELARANSLDLWQPDITWCGGITAGVRIVAMAHELGIPVSPHRGGEVWGLHLLVATDCADLAEYHTDHIRSDRDVLWLDEPEPKDGYLTPRDDPGFGVRLNESLL